MTLLAPPGHELLDRVLSGETLLESLHAGADVRAWVTESAGNGAAVLDAFGRGDELARVLLLPALALVPGPEADALLLDALDGPAREHAAWALGDRPVLPAALAALTALEADGGFSGMLAGLTLERWAAPAPAAPVVPAAPPAGRGLRIVQVFMQGYLDAGLTRAGAGDGGGLATLLVHLSAALAARPEVERVTTLTRAFGGDGIPARHAETSEVVTEGAVLERIPFGGSGYLATGDMWEHRAELERNLEAALRRLAPVDAVHLRFADVATLAAARVCERLGIPVYFTLAPDPHALIRRREESGALDRERFVAADRVEHLVFRARLVERLRDQARGLALLPRAGAREDLEELLRLPADDGGRRVRTVAEGISMGSVEAAARVGSATAVAAGLAERVQALPAARHGLPLILSVGRLHRVKGFPALLEAWAGAPELRGAFNLVIVGGDLEHPTAEERTVLAELRAGAVDGLLLLGHLPHREVIALMAAAQAGVGDAVGPDGLYACASEKEEFGLALLEALASGLSVLGPVLGGPSTFIEDGVTGVITDTSTVAGLRYGLYRAAVARMDPARAGRAMATVRERFTIDAMAAGLVDLYS
jgi:glycosyltransferase involved in cell wall biosynthesis